jgi:hypothetical protein
MLGTLDTPCLSFFSASLAGSCVLSVEHTAQILLSTTGLLPRWSWALIARATALAACTGRLVDIGCEARGSNTWLGSCCGLKRTVLSRRRARFCIVGEDPADSGEGFLDGTEEACNGGRGVVITRLGGISSTRSSCWWSWATRGGRLSWRLFRQRFVFTILFGNRRDGRLDVALKVFIADRETGAI